MGGRGDLVAPATLCERAFAIDERALSPDQPEVATDLHLLGRLREARGGGAGSAALYRRALTNFERRLGADHAHTRAMRARLAAVEPRGAARSPAR